MRAIPQWRVQHTSSPGETDILFEDGTTLTWLHPPANSLSAGGNGSFYQQVLAFGVNHKGQFQGTLDQFLEALEAAFPPRSLPEPVDCHDFIAEQVEEDRVDFYFTRGVLITYWTNGGRVTCQSEDSGDNPLCSACRAAFPHGVALLSAEEIHSVVEALCKATPMVKRAETGSKLEDSVPLRTDVPYKDWFPYDTVRIAARGKEPCQQEVMDVWWETLQSSRNAPQHLLVHAPTGLGKTVSALAPALAWQQQLPQKRQVYYLVATVNQHDNPIDTLQQLYRARTERGLATRVRVVDLVGQLQLNSRGRSFCIAPGLRPLHDTCTESRQLLSWNLLPVRPVSWREVADAIEPRGYCPYHYLQGLMAQADVVICDYWWIFHPDASQAWGGVSRFGQKDIALIVDEAHNLISRVRGAYDVAVSESGLKALLAKTPDHAAREALTPLLKLVFDGGALAEKARKSGLSSPELLAYLDRALLEESLAFWEQRRVEAQSDNELATEVRIAHNLLAPESDATVIYTVMETYGDKWSGAPEPVLKMRRIDTTRDLSLGYNAMKASITVSGTLVAPGDPEAELEKLVPQFGLQLESTRVLKAATPFPTTNQRWVYDSKPVGFYRSRGSWLSYYRNSIVATGKATPEGVTAVFFSSYSFMQALHDCMPPDEQRLIVCESRSDANMGAAGTRSLEDYETQLRGKMQYTSRNRAYLFALYSGKIAQGANFTGNLIKTAICVSVPAEMVELFHQRLCQHLWSLLHPGKAAPVAPLNDYFPEHKRAWGDAWLYAYERPAMFQVLQATGRGIRELRDRCAFVLLDQRYHEFKWHNFLRPAPFHTDNPHVHVESFHRGAPERFLAATNKWEVQLFCMGRIEE